MPQLGRMSESEVTSVSQCYYLQDSLGYAPPSDEDEVGSPSQSEAEEENEPDGVFSFRRKKYTNYHAVSNFRKSISILICISAILFPLGNFQEYDLERRLISYDDVLFCFLLFCHFSFILLSHTIYLVLDTFP